MRNPSRFAVIALAAAVIFCLPSDADYTRINQPNPDDPMDVHIFELDNGLRIYLTENHETPRFYAEVSVRAGSKHDPADATGLAHYLEHLLFKGNQNMGTLDYAAEKPYLDRVTELYEQHFRETDPDKRTEIYAEINRVAQQGAQYAIANEIDKLYSAMGGSAVNAHTWHEETVYKVALPSNRLRQWAEIESTRYIDPVFRLFHTELETVYEEKNRTLDNKSRVINHAVNDLLFKKHPYGQQPTIGSVEHLKNPSLKYIYNYFNTYYVPNNMTIAMSGDIDIDQAIGIIDEAFSGWERKALPEPSVWEEDPLNGIERTSVKYLGEEYVQVAFRTAPLNHEDTEALRLLDMILDNSVAGLINLNLNQRQRVRQAGSYPTFLNDYGAQYLYGIPKEGQTLEEVEALLIEQVGMIKRGEFEDWILAAIVNDLKKTRKTSLESNGARVNAMTNAFIHHTDWDAAVGELDRLARITKQEVVEVANKYFGDNFVVGYRVDEQHVLPSIDKPRIDPVEIDPSRQSQFAADLLAMPVDEIEPVFIEPGRDFKKSGGHGRTLYYAPNPLNDLFTLSITIEVGTRHNKHLAMATQLLDKSGAGDLSAEDLKKEWYKLGTDFGISAAANQTSIRISGLNENFEASLALMMKVLTRPTADDATLDLLKQIVLVRREDAKKDPQTLGLALARFHRYGSDSVFLNRLTTDEINELSVDELHAAIGALLEYEHTVAYTGPKTLRKVRSALKKAYPVPREPKKSQPYHFLRSRQPDQTEIYFFDKEMAQAQVRIEYPDGTFDESIHTPIELYNSYFAGGMSGIVFQELREARALAYSAGALYLRGGRVNEESLMVGIIGTQADKTIAATLAFLDIFDNLQNSPERFEETVSSLMNRYRTSKTGFRGVIGAVRAWDRQGLEVDPREDRFERLQQADLDALMDFHREHIQGKPKLISIVGDKNRIDMDALAEIGAVHEIGLDAIFLD